MANYVIRKQELNEALTRLQPNIPIEEYLSFTLRIDSYCTARDEALTGMCALIADTGDTKRETDVRDKLVRGRDVFKDTLGSALSSIQQPSKAGLDFQNMVVTDENRFWESLEKLNLGALRDTLRLRTDILKAYTENLKEKWERMMVENRPLLEAEKLATDQVNAWIDQAIAETADKMLKAKSAGLYLGEKVNEARRDTNDYFTQIGKQLAQKYLGDTPLEKEAWKKAWEEFIKEMRPAESLIKKIKDIFESRPSGLPFELKNWPKFILQAIQDLAAGVRNEYAKRRETYRDNMRKQIDRIFVIFSQTRKDTDAFIQNNGFDVAKKQDQETRDNLNRWGTDLPTEGLKKDGKDFSDAVIKGLNQHMTAMQEIYNNFLKEHEGRFLGVLGPDIQRALVGEREWDDHLSKLLGRGRGLEEKMRQWRSDTHQFLEIDLEEMLQMLKPIVPDLEGEQGEIQRQYQELFEGIRDEVMREARERIAEVDRIAEETCQMINVEKMLEDFKRTPLLEGLRP